MTIGVLLLLALFAAKRVVPTAGVLSRVFEFEKSQLSNVMLGGAFTPAVDLFAQYSIELAIASTAIILSFFFLKRPADYLQRRYFDIFNGDVFTPVRAPVPFDPLRGAKKGQEDKLLPWREPSEPSRKAVWDGVLALAQVGIDLADDGRGPKNPFGWTILMGESGSGKSRLAVEAVRRLARRNVVGDSAPRRRPRSWGEKAVAAKDRCWRAVTVRWICLGAWWRVQVCRRSPSVDDIWDAGWVLWVSPAGPDNASRAEDTPYPAWQKERELRNWIDDEGSRAWRPRRPTFLLLDDPKLEDAKGLITALEGAAKYFKYPVRLLVINQTAPLELELAWHDGAWFRESGLAPLVPVQTIRPEGRFNEDDLDFFLHRGMFGGNLEVRQPDWRREFLARTRGNPLLCEIGMAWLRDGRKLLEMTEHGLVAGRVPRIFRALEEAGLTAMSHKRAIAVATLVAGEAYGTRAAIESHYPIPINEPGQLERIYPAFAGFLNDVLPPIRPEMIGDAFVRAVLMLGDVSDQEVQQPRLIGAAWRVGPRAMMRSALRLGSFEDALGALFRADPPEGFGLNPYDMAMAYAEAAALLPRSEWDARHYHYGRQHESAAHRWIGRLSAEEAFRFANHFLTIVDRSTEETYIDRPEITSRILRTAVLRATTEARPSIQELVTFLERWNERPQTTVTRPGFWDAADPEICRAIKVSMVQACLQDDHAAAQAALLLRAAQALQHDVGFCEGIREFLETFTPTSAITATSDTTLVAQLRDAWLFVSRAYSVCGDPVNTENAARVVDRLSDLCIKAASSQNAWIRAQTWRNVARSFSELRDAVGAERAARTVGEIAKSYDAELHIQRVHAGAWGHVGFAFSELHDVVGAELAACTISNIVKACGDDAVIQEEHAAAWRNVAFAYCQQRDAAGARRAAQIVDDIAKLSGYNLEILRHRAGAWANVALALAERRDPVEAEVVANRIGSIVLPFGANSEIQKEHARAWKNVALAFGEQHDAAGAERAARVVGDIAEPFGSKSRVQEEHAGAWCNVALAFGHLQNTGGAERAAKTAGGIAAHFGADSRVQVEHATAWRNVAFAYCQQHDAVGARRAAQSVDDIAGPFGSNLDIQSQRAGAWANVALALAHRRDAVGAESIARQVADIAAPFGYNLRVQVEHARAWRNVAFAFSELHDAVEAERAARTVGDIAELCGVDRSIQRDHAGAWGNVAFAFSKLGKCAEAERAAKMVNEIAGGRSDLQDERNRVWRFVTDCQSNSGRS